MKFLVSALAALCAQTVLGDVYMHNPRGSNNRLNEANVNRNNGNRVFDSQNNGKGGYCVGPQMEFYTQSVMAVEWTNQHACGFGVNADCNIVLQYLCTAADAPAAERVRDGANTNRINNNQAGAEDTNRGMHESYASYQACEDTERNGGLFIADRNLNGDSAEYTRQNNNGNRNGLECPEERDYYPYWRPSQWKDIAVLTSDTTLCPWFQAESQNVKPRYVCANPTLGNNEEIPITLAGCNDKAGTWTEVPAHNLPAPDCLQAPFSRDNHLGNGVNGKANTYDWTMPTAEQEACVNGAAGCACTLRLRYNISTSDYQAWGTYNPATQQMEGFLDYQYDGLNSPITQDPTVASCPECPGVVGATGNNLSMALNTNQYGRTFQDRSYTFNLNNRPADVAADAKIINVNVRGKRGNIVQTYPAVEYDFAPTNLQMAAGEYVHFQWTGCDTNPAGNAGEGTAGTDRNNIVEVKNQNQNYPDGVNAASVGAENPCSGRMFADIQTRSNAAHAGLTAADGVKTYQQLQNDNNNNQNNIDADEGNAMKLNPTAARYVNLPLQSYDEPCTYAYMSTRNNNFTNRSQKASITVTQGALPTWGVALAAVGAVVIVSGLAVAGLFAFARTHPHSAVANMFSRS